MPFFLFDLIIFQFFRVSSGSSAGDVHAGHHLLPGHLLPVGLALPPAEEGHPSPQDAEEEDQEQGQGEGQAAGAAAPAAGGRDGGGRRRRGRGRRCAAPLRLLHAQEQNSEEGVP